METKLHFEKWGTAFMSRKWKKNSILYAWLQSYALVLLIPVMLMGIVYMQTHKVIKEEINRANSSLLVQLREEIDSQIEHVQRMRDVIAFNARVRKLLSAPNELDNTSRLTIVQALADFRTYNFTNRYIDNYYIYFRNGDFILTNTSYHKPDRYYELYVADSGLSYDAWRDFLDLQHHGVLGIDGNGEAEPGLEAIMLVQTLPVENPKSKLATLVIQMNKERLETSLGNVRTYNQGDVFIIDGDGRLVASSSNTGQAIPLDFPEDSESGIIQKTAGEQQFAVSYIRSKFMSWTYVYALPTAVYQSKAEYVRNLSVYVLLAATVLGTAVAVYAARRNYHPIQLLVQTISIKARKDPNQWGNEIHYIGETLEQALEQNDAMNRLIKQQNNVLRTNLLVRLLKGRLEVNFPLEEALAEYNLDMGEGPCAVLLFYIEDFSGLFREGEVDTEKNLRFVHLIMSNIIEEMVGKQQRGWVAEADEMLACIVNFYPGTEPAQGKLSLLHILEEARSLIVQRFHIEFTCSISNLCPSVQTIPVAYRQAVEAMEYRMLMGTGATIDFEHIREPGAGYVYPLEAEQKFINCVKSGDYEKAKSIMDEAIGSNLQEGSLSVDLARCFMFDLISTMMKASMEAAAGQSDLYEDNFRAVQAILQEQTIADMRARMDVFLKKVCAYVEERKSGRKGKLKEELLAHIDAFYTDPNLSLAGISQHFSLHPSYLSRFFKEQTGDSLSEYLNRYRMAKAKQLLLQDEVVVKNVGEAVGIPSISTFIRMFKKYEGITPGVYREIHKPEGEKSK